MQKHIETATVLFISFLCSFNAPFDPCTRECERGHCNEKFL